MQGLFGNISIFGNPHKYFFPFSSYRTKDKPAVGSTPRRLVPIFFACKVLGEVALAGVPAPIKKAPRCGLQRGAPDL